MHINEVLEVLRIINDESKQAIKMFSDSDNWNDRYTDTHGRIDRFSYLNTDPRILADQGLLAAVVVEDKSMSLWYKLIEAVRNKETVELIND
jgi:hypothetical protein